MTKKLFGWLPFAERTREQSEAHERIVAGLPRFAIRGLWKDEPGQYFLWRASQKFNGGKHIRYVFQTTGSCVGAGGGNALRTLIYVEMMLGQPEAFPASELWWPWTYGQSRKRAGLGGRGEGSFGSAWADAIVKDGVFSRDEYAAQNPPLPDFQKSEGWVRLPANVELEWSDGAAKAAFKPLGARHLVRTASRLRSSAEAKAALVNGYPVTVASMFGTRTIRAQGTPAVQLASWDDRWPHQMSVLACWDHPSLGLIFYVLNQWGSDAHPPPLNGEPPGGFWVKAATLDLILSSGEGYAFSAFDGFPARLIDWYI